MKFLRYLLVATTIGCTSTPATLIRTPVTVVPSGVDDSCGSVGIVVSNGTESISILARPESTAPDTLTVAPGSRLLLCETRGDWYGVVVLRKGLNCLSNDPANTSGYYDGPCDSGWIERSAVEFFAG